MSTLIDVIIPTFNRASVLKRAVDSVLNQDYPHYKLWVVDDGSTDETEELLAPYIKEGKLHYLKTENRGVSTARNYGVEKSEAPWIAFLDSDDEWLPHKLSSQMKFVEEHSHIPLVHGEEIWIRRGKRVNQKKIHQKFGGWIFERCLPLCLISPSAVMLKRDLYLEMGGFDEDYWRVKSMDRILKIRQLSAEQVEKVSQEIVRKGRVLLQGYEKHGNMTDFPEINEIVERHTQK